MHPHDHAGRSARRAARLGASLLALTMAGGLAMLPLATSVRAAGPTMSAKVMLGGHTRLSAWAAITVDLANDGPAVTGELRLTGGSQGRTRYSLPVDLPTGSSKRLTVYAQPSAFRSTFDLVLVATDGSQVASTSLKVVNHDPSSPLVAVIAERPQGVVPGVQAALNANPQGLAATVITLRPADLPDRVEGWGPLDRLVWQDVATDQLSDGQLSALRTWVAGGGRLLLLGGTAGSGVFGALPDELLPYRPSTTADVQLADLTGLLGSLPSGAAPLPASAGVLLRGRPLLRAGDLVAAATADLGRGSVTLVGFDPATAWLSGSSAGSALWRLAMPSTGGAGTPVNPALLTDDSQLLQALYALPTLDLPPIDLLVVLLVVYTILIGPLNYLVLKRLDRREWAWVTMPALVLLFSVGSYGIGLNLHGADTIANELSIVSGTAGTDVGRAQVYVGVFSPSRRTFDVELGGPLLVTSPISEYLQSASQAGLDVVQGERARVRGLEVGVSDLRTFRGEVAADAPLVEADLRLEGAVIRGSLTNRSGRTLENLGVALGSRALRIGDLADGVTAQVLFSLDQVAYGGSISEQLFGTYPGLADRSVYVRRAMLDQLTAGLGKVPTGGPGGDHLALLAFDSRPVAAVSLGNGQSQHVADTLYLLSLPLRAGGEVVLTSALIGRQIIESNATWASDDGSGLSLGEGSMTVAFQAIPLGGEFRANRLVVGLLGSGDFGIPVPDPAPLPPSGAGGGTTGGATTGDAPALPFKPGPEQGVPTFELFDRAAGAWVAFEPLAMGSWAVIANPERFIDQGAGLLVRLSYDDPLDQGQQAYFNLGLRIEGVVE